MDNKLIVYRFIYTSNDLYLDMSNVLYLDKIYSYWLTANKLFADSFIFQADDRKYYTKQG